MQVKLKRSVLVHDTDRKPTPGGTVVNLDYSKAQEFITVGLADAYEPPPASTPSPTPAPTPAPTPEPTPAPTPAPAPTGDVGQAAKADEGRSNKMARATSNKSAGPAAQN